MQAFLDFWTAHKVDILTVLLLEDYVLGIISPKLQGFVGAAASYLKLFGAKDPTPPAA